MIKSQKAKLFLGCKSHWFTKKRKTNVMSEVVSRKCSVKKVQHKCRVLRSPLTTQITESHFNNVADHQTCYFVKRGPQRWYSPANFVKVFRRPFLQNTFTGDCLFYIYCTYCRISTSIYYKKLFRLYFSSILYRNEN